MEEKVIDSLKQFHIEHKEKHKHIIHKFDPKKKMQKLINEEYESMDIPEINTSFAASSYSSGSSLASYKNENYEHKEHKEHTEHTEQIDEKLEEKEEEEEEEEEEKLEKDKIELKNKIVKSNTKKKDTVSDLINMTEKMQVGLNDILYKYFPDEESFDMNFLEIPVEMLLHNDELIRMNTMINNLWNKYEEMYVNSTSSTPIFSESDSEEEANKILKNNFSIEHVDRTTYKKNEENEENEEIKDLDAIEKSNFHKEKREMYEDIQDFESIVFELERICLTFESFVQFYRCDKEKSLKLYLHYEIDYHNIFSCDL